MKKKFSVLVGLVVLFSLILSACVPSATSSNGAPLGKFAIESGSGGKLYLDNDSEVQQLVKTASKTDIYSIFSGTGKIKNNFLAASKSDGAYKDAMAFMPEAPFWIPSTYSGDSIATSKMVLGVTKEFLIKNGLKPGDVVNFSQIEGWINNHELELSLCNPTQCNSGALFYFSDLAYFSNTSTLDVSLTTNQEVTTRAQSLVANIDITTSSTGDARKEFEKSLKDKDGVYNAIFSYEPEVAALNASLISSKLEPVYVLYVDKAIDATQTLVMSPAFKDDINIKDQYARVKNALVSKDIQKKISEISGWRSVVYGVPFSPVLKAEWGFLEDPQVTAALAPKYEVAMPLLKTYVQKVRKPVVLMFFLDFSGSMRNNNGYDQLIAASKKIFDQETASTDFLDAREGDFIQVFLFDNTCVALPVVNGVDPQGYKNLLTSITTSNMQGNTFMYACGKTGLEQMKANYAQLCSTTHNCGFVFLTDGGDNQCRQSPDSCITAQAFNDAKTSLGLESVPIWVVPFTDKVDKNQINAIKSVKVCQDTLEACFKSIKGSR